MSSLGALHRDLLRVCTTLRCAVRTAIGVRHRVSVVFVCLTDSLGYFKSSREDVVGFRVYVCCGEVPCR